MENGQAYEEDGVFTAILLSFPVHTTTKPAGPLNTQAGARFYSRDMMSFGCILNWRFGPKGQLISTAASGTDKRRAGTRTSWSVLGR